MSKFSEKWSAKFKKEPAAETVSDERSGLEKTKDVICGIGLWIYRLRALFLAIPVVAAALKLARINYELLPDVVGLDLQNNGEFSHMVAKEVAVYGPLAVTAVCLLMVLLSRKTTYPWLISILSLVIPLIILMINVFPS